MNISRDETRILVANRIIHHLHRYLPNASFEFREGIPCRFRGVIFQQVAVIGGEVILPQSVLFNVKGKHLWESET